MAAAALDDIVIVIVCSGRNVFEVPHLGTSSRQPVPPSTDFYPPGPANCLCQQVSETFVEDGVDDEIDGWV